jgi:hypothetical protein
MKKCGCCGRENENAAMHYVECGTEFRMMSAGVASAVPRDRTWREWLKFVLTCLGTILCVGLIYLLSLGPVQRCCMQTTSRTWTTTVNGHETVTTIVHTVRFPRWVGIVYGPALSFRSGGDPAGLYGRYLDWWGKRQPRR